MIIQFENVSKSYDKNIDALHNVSMQIEKGEFVFIVGSSGSGKTTLMRLLLKEMEPTSGRIVVAGNELSALRRGRIPAYRRNIGVVFQDFRLLKDRSVYDNVAFALQVIGKSRKFIKKQVPAMLDAMGLTVHKDSYPQELSGGEQQRAALARALINRPFILLADEPTGNLDPQNAWDIMRLLEDVNKSGTTVIVVTHNREIVDSMQKRVITLQKGVLVSDEKKGGYSYDKR